MKNDASLCSLKANIRDSNMELLRIVAMLMIIMHHCIVHSGIETFALLKHTVGANTICATALGIWGRTGVVIFVTITSWYMCDKKAIHLKKIFNIVLMTIEYGIILSLIFALVAPSYLSLSALIHEWGGYTINTGLYGHICSFISHFHFFSL